jgi:Ca2+-binding EF-hand superfamily protein
MLTNFQSKKLTYFFGLYDLNKNDYLQLEDFTDIAEKLCEKLEYQPDSKHYKKLVEKTVGLFYKLMKDIPHGDNQFILLDDWLRFFDTQVIGPKNEEMLEEYAELIIGYLFDLFDDNNDGYISLEEYKGVFEIYGIDQHYLEKSFLNLDLNNDRKLSRYELIRSVETFLTSDDALMKGNWIFGNWAQIKTSVPNQ